MSAHSMVHQRRRSGRRSALHRRRSSSPFSPCEESGKDRRRSNRQSIATISSVESVSTNSSTSILAPQLIAMSNHTIYLTNHIPTNTLKWSVRIGDIHLSVKRWWTDVYIYIFFFQIGMMVWRAAVTWRSKHCCRVVATTKNSWAATWHCIRKWWETCATSRGPSAASCASYARLNST